MTLSGGFAGPFRAAELLYQQEEYDAAAQRLAQIAKVADGDEKICALSRLVLAECDAGRIETGLSALRGARQLAKLAGNELRERTQAELLVGAAHGALVLNDRESLARSVQQLELLAARAQHDPHLWSQAARARFYLAYHQYVRYEIADATGSCASAFAHLARDGDAKPFVRVPLLALRALLREHSFEHAHLAVGEMAEAYELAVRHGMVVTARGLLYNALLIPVTCDDLRRSNAEMPLTKSLARTAEKLALFANDVRLQAVATTAAGRLEEALPLFDRARAEHGEDFFWNPVLMTLNARALFLAGRVAQSEQLARTATSAWERSGLRRQGIALRVWAESLEALGRRRAAVAVVRDALDALEPYTPVYHLLAAYRCAQRLSPRPAYRDRVESLSETLRRTPPSACASERGSLASCGSDGRLTPRQREIALLIVGGRTNASIAGELGISMKTVANHVATIFDRLGLRARWQLTRDAIPD